MKSEGDAIYFSRAAIPFIREAEKNEWTRSISSINTSDFMPTGLKL